jgi:hypothetical protein
MGPQFIQNYLSFLYNQLEQKLIYVKDVLRGLIAGFSQQRPRFQSQNSSCWISGGQSGTETDLSPR